MSGARSAPRLRLVVPCYNEADRLRPDAFLELVLASDDVALLFVDDGSTDGTPAILADLAARGQGRIGVLTLARNAGKAVAVQRGLVQAAEQLPAYVGYWDADLSTPLAELPAFLGALDGDERLDIVIGARVKLLGRQIVRSELRHYIGRVFATAASVALGVAVYDTQCGAKVLRVTPAVARAVSLPFRSAWVFDVELLARYITAVGRPAAVSRICELPLRVWTDVPGSKVRCWDAFRAARDLARIGWQVRRPGARR